MLKFALIGGLVCLGAERDSLFLRIRRKSASYLFLSSWIYLIDPQICDLG